MLGTFILPLACSMAAHVQSRIMAGMKSDMMRKYLAASATMSGPPPSHTGSCCETAAPSRPMTALNPSTHTSACRRTSRAPLKSLPPIRCATCTEKPLVTAIPNPPISHRHVLTRPIDAPAAGPRCPTMEVSMYCIITEDSCARMAG